MDPNRNVWNEQHKALRAALTSRDKWPQAVDLFFQVHSMVHTAELSQGSVYSLEDEIWPGLTEAQFRRIPPKAEHSIVWNIWHLARIEDVTMNILVAGQEQVFTTGGWQSKLGVTACETGNSMSQDEIVQLSQQVDLEALRAYRLAVGRSTQEVVKQLRPDLYKQKVDSVRLKRIVDEGAVLAASTGLLAYWGGLTMAGLLLMPPTRHNLVHINESLTLKNKK
jgi:hypothetical protein